MNEVPPPELRSEPDSPAQAGADRPRQELRRELLAIAVLYLVLSVLPLLVGLAFRP